MDYEKLYKEALERARKKREEYKRLDGDNSFVPQDIESIFPELKSEDERIRNAIKEAVEYYWSDNTQARTDIFSWLKKQGEKDSQIILPMFTFDDILALQCCIKTFEKDEKLYNQLQSLHDRVHDSYWLEKQGEQKKPTDKVELKFKVGDWCINNEDNTIFQITKVLSNLYYYRTNEGKEYSCTRDSIERDAHLWTIKDAKEGDVLAGNYDNCKKPWIGIFKCISKDRLTTQFDSHCFLNSSHHVLITPLSCDFYNQCKGHTIRYALPATKEQRDLLLSKMKEAGYEWAADKKELRTIEQKETLCDKCRKTQPSHSCQDITELGRCALEKQG